MPTLTRRRLFLRAGIAAGAGACIRTGAAGKPASGPGREGREGLRIAFMTDMQFDGPPGSGHRFGLAEQGNPNNGEGYNIALQAWQAMMDIQPDLIFDAGDLAADGEDEDLTVKIGEDDWFLIPKGEQGTVEFQQQWAEPVKILGVTVEAEGGRHANVLYKAADHPLGDWTDYRNKPPERTTLLRVRIEFEADKNAPMRVHDVTVTTDQTGAEQ